MRHKSLPINMENNDEEIIELENDTEETANDADIDNQDKDESIDEVELLKKKLATAEAQKAHWKEKANKPKEAKEEEPKSEDLSSTDLYALLKADVSEEDMDMVKDYAKFKKISVSEALKSSVVKSELANKAEERKTAQVSNSGNTRRANSSKTSGDDLLAKTKSGDFPENDADIDKMLESRYSPKKRD